ncbi:DUF5134 domain-containing protein [Burkholderia gladioli]|uniref:DUF5134 domain-containing protein n=1 Tax=Burkholderia gladioli TaxID=28095 RepID=UPI001640C579|nr:DUF5134 domain-containing protein [Burkholderia gladioli]
MNVPAWWSGALAALVIAAALPGAWRVALARMPVAASAATMQRSPRRRPRRVGRLDAEISALLMALAMAGMLLPSFAILPDRAWAATFVLGAAWFVGRCTAAVHAAGFRALGNGHDFTQVLHCAASAYMFASAPIASMCAQAPGIGKYLSISSAIAFVLVGDCLREGCRASVARAPVPGASADVARSACRIVMGMAMAAMLLAMP